MNVEPGWTGSKDLFEGLLESAPDAIVVVDTSGTIRLVNRQTEVLFGYSRAELLGEHVEVLVPRRIGEAHPGLRDSYFRDPRTRPMGAGLVLTARRKDESEFPVDISLSPLRTEHGMLVSAAVRDITDRVVAEGIRASLAAIVSSSQEAIIGKDLDGTIASWNPGAQRIYGYTEDEVIGKSVMMLLWPEQVGMEKEILERVRSGERVDVYETTRATKDGRSVDVSVSISPIRDPRGTIVGIASINSDISERKRALARLQGLQSQRLESLGQLAGGIAHDFNNLLGAIVSYAGLIREDPTNAAAVVHDIAQIQEAAERASALTHQLLIFGRREVVNPQVISLNTIVSDLERLLRRTIGENIDLRTRLDSHLLAIRADPTGIEQLVMNLVVNARDAIVGSGTIAIHTENTEISEELEAAPLNLQPGRYVRISVSDTGSGMAEDVIARAFEPFFTTKERGRGSGLGLATVYGIVTQSGGDVRIYSNPGLGTTVRAYFPAAEGVPVPAQLPMTSLESLHGSGETILLVEDERQVREPTVRVLTRRGYKVLAAANGPEALDIVRNAKGAIDLLLTDVVMPTMSGKELSDELHRILPDIRVLFMSGYPQDVLERGAVAAGLPLMEKPFTTETLLRRIRSMLADA